MPLTRMAFSPESGLNDKIYFPSAPGSEEEARAQVQEISNQLKEYLNETLLPQLENTLPGQSGAERIGSAAIEHVAGDTVREQLADIKRQLDNIVGGAVSDGTIHTQMIMDGAVTKAKLAPDTLKWTLVAQSGVLDASDVVTIPSQMGKSEMMVQFCQEEGDIASGVFVGPLNESGILTPSIFTVYASSLAGDILDSRTVYMTSATTLTVGLSGAENAQLGTRLKRINIYAR